MSEEKLKQFEDWLKKYRKKNGEKLTQTSIELYIFLSESFFKKIDNYELNDMIEIMNKKLKSTQSNTLCAAYRNILRFFGYEDDDILKRIKSPRRRSSAVNSKRTLQSKIFNKKEIENIIQYAIENYDTSISLLIVLLFDTAARKGEIIETNGGAEGYQGVKIRDINFKDNEMEVTGKGLKRRIVFFNDKAKELMYRHIREKGLLKDDRLITLLKKDGTPYTVQEESAKYWVSKVIKNAIEKHGTPHYFRHSRLSEYANAGADILDIKEIAGHEDIKTSQIYVHSSDRRRRDAFKKFGKQ